MVFVESLPGLGVVDEALDQVEALPDGVHLDQRLLDPGLEKPGSAGGSSLVQNMEDGCTGLTRSIEQVQTKDCSLIQSHVLRRFQNVNS